MRTTCSTDRRSTRIGASRRRVPGVAVALLASATFTVGVILVIPPSAVVGREPVCSAQAIGAGDVRTDAPDASGTPCDDRQASHRLLAWPQRAWVPAGADEAVVGHSPDRAVTWTAIALAESGGETGT